MTAEDRERTVTAIVRLAPGEQVDLDLEWCDVVPSATSGPQLRLKGRLLGADGRPERLARLFFDLEMIEQPLRRAGVLRDPIPELPAGETTLALPVLRRRLTLGRAKNANGATWYTVRLRDGAVDAGDEQMLADYSWAYAQARNVVVPLMVADQLPVGAGDVLAIARTLFHERRRSRPGRE